MRVYSTPEAIAEIFSKRLGREIGVNDLIFTPQPDRDTFVEALVDISYAFPTDKYAWTLWSDPNWRVMTPTRYSIIVNDRINVDEEYNPNKPSSSSSNLE